MQTSLLTKLRNSLRSANEWFLKTAERALDEAYQAARSIKAIEDQHFNGGKISSDYGSYSKTEYAYFQPELKRYLNIIKVRLAEFKSSSSVLRLSNQRITEVQLQEVSADVPTISIIDQPALILKKLKLIDEVLTRYSNTSYGLERQAAPLVTYPDQTALTAIPPDREGTSNGERPPPPVAYRDPMRPRSSINRATNMSADENRSIADKTGVLPRSILNTVDRIKRELDPESEAEMVEKFRNTKARTLISIRFVLLLLLIPLLTQQVSKYFIVGPIVDHFRDRQQVETFLNAGMEEEAFQELRVYEERLRFEVLIGKTPPLSPEQMEIRLVEKAEELEAQYQTESTGAIKNIFSDILAAIAFAFTLVNSKREIAILKSFIDELIYGLSDSAKAFIIILLTDTFVGFHSPHGWEVLLEGLSRHFGLPANHDFIFLFIATFPVLLDTIFKYWIFRYLNRISPSAVATYRNMNE